jgi:hypothetical protein
VEEITGLEAKSISKEGGEHHDLICIGCGKVFAGGRMPLQHCAIWEKVIHNELARPPWLGGGIAKAWNRGE